MAEMLKRFREPSTYAGLGVLLGVVGVSLAPADLQSVVWLLSGLAGVVAMFVKEKPAA
jgi:hypothetical protein